MPFLDGTAQPRNGGARMGSCRMEIENAEWVTSVFERNKGKNTESAKTEKSIGTVMLNHRHAAHVFRGS